MIIHREMVINNQTLVIYRVKQVFQVYHGLSLKYIGTDEKLAGRIFNTQRRLLEAT